MSASRSRCGRLYSRVFTAHCRSQRARTWACVERGTASVVRKPCCTCDHIVAWPRHTTVARQHHTTSVPGDSLVRGTDQRSHGTGSPEPNDRVARPEESRTLSRSASAWLRFLRFQRGFARCHGRSSREPSRAPNEEGFVEEWARRTADARNSAGQCDLRLIRTCRQSSGL